MLQRHSCWEDKSDSQPKEDKSVNLKGLSESMLWTMELNSINGDYEAFGRSLMAEMGP